MHNTNAILKRFGGNICRRCLNAEIEPIHLSPDDCVYQGYGTCPLCQQQGKHIVMGFTLRGKIKLIGKKPSLH